MPTSFPLLRIIAESALRICGVPDSDRQGGFLAMTRPQLTDKVWVDALPELAQDVWEHWSHERSAEQRRTELEELARIGAVGQGDNQTMNRQDRGHGAETLGEDQTPAEVQALLQRTVRAAEEFEEQLNAVVEELCIDRSDTLRQALILFLSDVPSTIRLGWRRAEDL